MERTPRPSHTRGILSGSNDGVAAVASVSERVWAAFVPNAVWLKALCAVDASVASEAETHPMPRELALAAQNKAKHGNDAREWRGIATAVNVVATPCTVKGDARREWRGITTAVNAVATPCTVKGDARREWRNILIAFPAHSLEVTTASPPSPRALASEFPSAFSKQQSNPLSPTY